MVARDIGHQNYAEYGEARHDEALACKGLLSEPGPCEVETGSNYASVSVGERELIDRISG